MSEPAVPWGLLDAALRGALLITLLLLVSEMRRRLPQWRATHVGTLMAMGLCVQIISATPWFEASVPWTWQAPAVAVSVGNAALFWVFVQALFIDDFKWTPWYVGAWLTVVALTLSRSPCNAPCPWCLPGWPSSPPADSGSPIWSRADVACAASLSSPARPTP
jgi:hypothetical protein